MLSRGSQPITHPLRTITQGASQRRSDRGPCFFFQAEGGIRGGRVTGVQTCALPISPWAPGTGTRGPHLPSRQRRSRAQGRRPRGGAGAMRVEPSWYLVLSALLFTIGVAGVLIRRNAIVVFMCIELMLNAVNLSFIAFSKLNGDLNGQILSFFVMVVAAAEVVVGLGILVAIFRKRSSTSVDDVNLLKG